jgi:hypothetical protein
MRKVKSYKEFVNENESANILNESFSVSPTAEAIFKEIDKKYDYVQLNADTYQAIKLALASTSGNMLHSYEEIVKSTTFNKKLQRSWITGIHKDIRFYFNLPFSNGIPVAGDKIVSILNRQPGRKNYTVWEYNDGEWFSGWGGADRETHFIKTHPKLFTEKDYEVYAYSDINRGFGNAGTVEFVKGKTIEDAKKNVKAKGADKYDPFWIEHGIHEIDANEIAKKKKEIKAMAAHYAKLAKEMGI